MAEATDRQRFLHRNARRLWSKWGVVPVVVLSLVVLSVFAFRLSQLRGVPDIGHPFDVEAFGTINIDSADNAKTDYDHVVAWMTLSSEPDGDDLDRALKGSWSDATPEVRQWLDDNEEILKLWQEGTEKNHYLIEQPKDLTSWNTMHPVSETRAISRLSRLAAMKAEANGQFGEAWNWHRASFRHSRHLGMYDTNSPMLGTYFHLMTVEGIIPWANSETVTAEQLSRALGDILEADKLTVLLSSMIRAEYFETLDEMRKSYQLVMKKMGVVIDGFGVDRVRFPGAIEMFFENDPELTRRLLQHQVANLLTFADLPISERPALVSTDITYFEAVSDEATFMPPKDFLKAVGRSPYARLTLLKAGWINGSLIREHARQTMLEVTLAAEWYRRIHGTYPESLEELVAAEMLISVPLDPMSLSGGFIGFERDPDDSQQAKVWSAGRNKVDDGGSLDNPHPYHVKDYGFKIGRKR